MNIPSFLRPENVKPNPKADRITHLTEEYRKKIGGMLIIEPSNYSLDEWIEMLQECIDRNITIWELWGEKYDPEADY